VMKMTADDDAWHFGSFGHVHNALYMRGTCIAFWS
jgi:hypothetical protein